MAINSIEDTVGTDAQENISANDLRNPLRWVNELYTSAYESAYDAIMGVLVKAIANNRLKSYDEKTRSAVTSYFDYMNRGHFGHALSVAEGLNLPNSMQDYARAKAMGQYLNNGNAKIN